MHTKTTTTTAEATCEKDGYKTTKCSVCDYTATETITGDHKWVAGTKLDPTCTVDGHEAGEVCSVCGATRGQETISATDHNWADGWTSNDVDHWHDCTNECGEKGSVANHNWDEGKVTKAAKENEPGERTLTCNDCGATKTESIDPTGNHNWDEGKVTQEATCTLPEITTYTCKDCGETKTTTKSSLGHDMGEYTETTAATCVAEGIATSECSRCDYKETKTLEKLDHDLTTVTVDATCEEDGSETTTCSRCDYKDVVTLPKLGHDWDMDNGTVTLKPTCIAKGTMTYTCTHKDCEATHEVDIESNPDAHTKVAVDDAVAASCTETGLTEGSHCEDCHIVLVEQETVEMLPHTVLNVNGEPATCTDEGWTAGEKCSVCGEVLTEQEVIAALGHAYGDWTDNGSTHIRVCANDPTHVETVAHTYGGWVTRVAATTESTGLRVRTCSACGHEDTRVIARLIEEEEEGDTPNPNPPQVEIPDENPPLTDEPGTTPGGDDGDDDSDVDVEIPEEDVPLAPAPEDPEIEIPEEDVPLAPAPEEPEIEIPEEDVPLAPAPADDDDDDDNADGGIEIPEDDVPLADVPDTGDNSGMWLITAALSATGLFVLTLTAKRKEEEE